MFGAIHYVPYGTSPNISVYLLYHPAWVEQEGKCMIMFQLIICTKALEMENCDMSSNFIVSLWRSKWLELESVFPPEGEPTSAVTHWFIHLKEHFRVKTSIQYLVWFLTSVGVFIWRAAASRTAHLLSLVTHHERNAQHVRAVKSDFQSL